MNNSQLQLFGTNRQTNASKIFATILAVILSLTLSCTTNPCFATNITTNTGSTNTSFFSNTTAIVTTAAIGALGIGAILVGLLSNNNSSSNNNNSSSSSTAVLASIAVTSDSNTIASGTTQQFIATGHYSDGTTKDLTSSVTWNSSDSAVATISNVTGSQGLATGVTAGTNITITATDSATSIGGAATLTVTVTAATLSSIAVTPDSLSIVSGASQQFTAIGHYSDNTIRDLTNSVTWSSSNSAIAKISNTSGFNGLATAATTTSDAITTITATLSDIISPDITLTVTAATLSSIVVTSNSNTIASSTTQQFIAIGLYSDGTTKDLTSSVTWSSSNTSTATIESNGLATADHTTSIRTTTITAKLFGITSPGITLTVTAAATLFSIAVTSASLSIASGITQQFIATGHYSDGTTRDLTNSVTWNSSAPAVAIIDSQGLVTGVTTGTNITITATDSATSIGGAAILTITAATVSL